MNDTHRIQERISALVDGESSRAEADAALIANNAAWAEQHCQYKTIGRLIRALPDVEPSKTFVTETLRHIPPRNSRARPGVYWGVAAAAALIVVLAVSGWLRTPSPAPEHPWANADASEGMAASYAHLDLADEYMFLFMPDFWPETCELTDTLAYFGAVDEDQLLIALAHMLLEAYAPDGAAVYPEFPYLNQWQTEAPEPLNALNHAFFMLETLNDAEALALNIWLRDVLANA